MASGVVLPLAAQAAANQQDRSWLFGDAPQLIEMQRVTRAVHSHPPAAIEECETAAALLVSVKVVEQAVILRVVQMVVFTLLSLIVSEDSEYAKMIEASGNKDEILKSAKAEAESLGERSQNLSRTKLRRVVRKFLKRKKTQKIAIAGKNSMIASSKVRLMKGLEKVLGLLPSVSTPAQREVLRTYVGKYCDQPLLSAHMLHLSKSHPSMKMAILESMNDDTRAKEMLFGRMTMIESNHGIKTLMKLSTFMR